MYLVVDLLLSIGALSLEFRTNYTLTYQVIFFCSMLLVIKKVVMNIKEGSL